MNDVLHALIPSTVLFDITNIDKGTEGTLRKFADDIKLKQVGDMLEGRAATQGTSTSWKNVLAEKT